jgi:large subunit ribosomal protein L1
LKENARALLETLLRMKPATSKGQYVRSAAISSTMGIGIKLDPSAITVGLR